MRVRRRDRQGRALGERRIDVEPHLSAWLHNIFNDFFLNQRALFFQTMRRASLAPMENKLQHA